MSERFPLTPFDTGRLPIGYSGNPGVNGVPLQGCQRKTLGVGTPIPLGIDGLDVLDLGSGSGQDCYIAAALVGETGSVTGVDMTEEQLSVARGNTDAYCTGTLGYAAPNMSFKTGYLRRPFDPAWLPLISRGNPGATQG